MTTFESCSKSTLVEPRSVSAAFVRAQQTLGVFWQRACSRRRLRRELARLDDALLRDAGLRCDDVVREAGKPFWQA